MEGSTGYLVYDLLPTGKENAISTKELMLLTGCTSARELCAHIERERWAGAMILSATTGGYFKPKSREEIKEYARTQRSRGLKTMSLAHLAERVLKVLEGQMELEIK